MGKEKGVKQDILRRDSGLLFLKSMALCGTGGVDPQLGGRKNEQKEQSGFPGWDTNGGLTGTKVTSAIAAGTNGIKCIPGPTSQLNPTPKW